MRVLLDTHVALWAVAGSTHLSRPAEQAIVDADEVWVSAASVWEIAIKHALGRGDMPVTAEQAVQAFHDAGYSLLHVTAEHAAYVERLPVHHKDPFDRLLVAQAVTEPLVLLTADQALCAYGDLVRRV